MQVTFNVRGPWARATRAALAMLGLAIILASVDPAEGRGDAARVTEDLVVLYTFAGAEEGLIPDRSGLGEPLNLHLESPQATLFRGGHMIVTSSARISTAQPAGKIIAAVKQSNSLTVEAWLTPAESRQSGPARIVTLSDGPSQRNFTLAQEGRKFDVRLRTSAADRNGIPSLSGSDTAVSGELTHVVYTRDARGWARIYLNGKQDVVKAQEGLLDNWSDDFHLALANELTGDRPWLGELHLVAIYGRALSAGEVQGNFDAGVPAAVDYGSLLPPPRTGPVDFVKEVQPLLRERCFQCHLSGNEEGGVNLGIRQRVLEGGDQGPIVIPRDSANSRLIHLVAAIDKDQVMPPDDTPLSHEEVGLLRAWIDQGLVWPDGADMLDPRAERAKTHWAFQPLRGVAVPDVQGAAWPHTPIDRFILANLEAAGIRPSPRADPRRLIRRLSFDLIGLPPTPEEVRDFCAAAERDWQDALTSLVDRLLRSPHYGERWGRHWLDVARYADSDGQESDRDRPLAYHFRDFVIQAFNDDMPFDQFVRWQLAGDEFAPDNPQALAATGFIVAGPFAALPDNLMEDERLRNRYNELDDILATVGTGMLGLTLGCARCHDHKYDAIPARDYYRLLSAFHSGERAEIPLGTSDEKTLGFRETDPQPQTTWLFQRANYYDRDQPVQLGFVSVLTPRKTAEEYWHEARAQSPAQSSTNQRRALADWMTDVDQGAGALLARVIVNRLWQHHFQQGIVRTVGDFGVRSEPPTHPELLEWLAHDLVQNGWRIKRLQRMIVLSEVYLQASNRADATRDIDNRLLSRMPLQRLEAEILRDSLLAVAGRLNDQLFGPAVRVPIAPEAMLARNLKDPYPADIADGPELRRRSIYLFHKRVVPHPLLMAFDKPDAQQSCSRRDRTTVAPQALALLNDQFVRAVATELADRLLQESGSEPVLWIDRGFQLALSRSPSEQERAAAIEFVSTQIQQRRGRDPQAADDQVRRLALADFCQVLFGLNEFIYVD
jgi:hypothetical protein